MLELEPDPMSIPDISITNGRRTVARRSNGENVDAVSLQLESYQSRVTHFLGGGFTHSDIR